MEGFSTEFEYKGQKVYVQTQDAGLQARSFETFIYRAGKLLTSRKMSYSSYLGQPSLQNKINELMKTQHEAIVRDVLAGKFDHFLKPRES